MWVQRPVCGPVAFIVGSVADNVGLSTFLFADNVVQKQAIIVSPRVYDCRPLQLAARDAPFLAFHVDHIIARQHGGTDDPDNPALACLWCNLHKGPNLSGIDPETGQITALFHPRRDRWSAHFALRGVHIIGRTPTGRATVQVLNMNAPERMELRIELIDPEDSG
jgi:hypothetical protein